MTREEQVERALEITKQMRSNAVPPCRQSGKSLLTWTQVDARDELAELVGAKAKAAVAAAPPERDE